MAHRLIAAKADACRRCRRHGVGAAGRYCWPVAQGSVRITASLLVLDERHPFDLARAGAPACHRRGHECQSQKRTRSPPRLVCSHLPPLPHLATGTYLPPSPRRLWCEPVTVTGPARRRASAMHTRRELGGSARPDSTPTWLPPARARPSPSPPVRIPSPLRPRRHYARKTQCHDLARLCRDRIAMETPTSFSLFRRVGGPTPTRTFSAH